MLQAKKTYQPRNIISIQQMNIFIFFRLESSQEKHWAYQRCPAHHRHPHSGQDQRPDLWKKKIIILFCEYTYILSIRREYRGGVHNEVASRWEAIINMRKSQNSCSFTFLATAQNCFAKPQNFFLIRVELLFHFFGNHPKLFYQSLKLLSNQSGVALPAGWLKWIG